MKLDLITSLYVFMLAAFIGFEVIRRVSPLLHTPLMSLTNALDTKPISPPFSAPSPLSPPPATSSAAS
jgi:NAD/NADP transhydrogenase alpha subunit